MSQISSLNKVCMHFRRFSELVWQEFVCITHWPGLSFETRGSIILVKSESHPACVWRTPFSLPCDGVHWSPSYFSVAHSISVKTPQKTDPICVFVKHLRVAFIFFLMVMSSNRPQMYVLSSSNRRLIEEHGALHFDYPCMLLEVVHWH